MKSAIKEAAKDMSHDSTPAHAKSVLSTILLLLGVGIVVGALMTIYGQLGIDIGLTAFGSLFLLYWAGILHQSRADFLPAFVGGLFGIALAWLLIASPRIWGTPAAVAGGAVLVVVLFFYLRGEMRPVINNATMLFLLVAAIPQLEVGSNALVMVASLTIGAAYIGAITAMAATVRAKLAIRKA